MHLDGSIPIRGPADLIIRGLADSDTLAAIAPFGFEFRKGQTGVTAFTMRRAVGPMSLTLQGTMQLIEQADGASLEISASHIVAGKVVVNLALASGPMLDEFPCSVVWRGEINSHGIAARILATRAGEAGTILRNLFLRLRDHVEGIPNTEIAASPD